ncbi:choice-of-anchor L family PEP-CTERM protein [Leptolyngbya sp. PCC 6406]|uniref:choice-of-anchor L family PEP-CTERM protein n=1 Tax=Leptolyngbya sp. PCC 6406 TaxID=1173264 RepID=UPI0002ACF79B|nr:choice-of-anchor L domain-containing protein [Leptolyngbya sp. PCC 6406]
MHVTTKTSFFAGAVAIAATSTLWSTPVAAFTVNQNNDGLLLLTALLGDTTGLNNFDINLTGDSRSFGTFLNDPFGLDSGVVLSTGRVVDLPGPNTADNYIPGVPNSTDLSTNLGRPGVGPISVPGFGTFPTFDLAQLDISFDADDTVSALFFNYVFGSEEFVEYGGTEFNDQFELLLNGVNLAKLNNGQTVSINNLVPNPSGPYNADYINNPAGSGVANTRLDGFTVPLTFQGNVLQNARNILSIRIFDVGDGILDSAVFVQGGSLRTEPVEPEPVEPEPVDPPQSIPEPGTILGLLGMAGAAVLSRRRARNQGG